jgi:MarR family transcriptional regulator, 2-MHQ and catechol-resistance regulon repressor
MPKITADDDLSYVQTSLGDDLDAMLVFNILRTYSYLGPSLDASLRDSKLTGAQFNTLLVLRSAGPGGMLMSEIGERLIVSKSNMTGLIDRMEAQGLVARGGNDDRRATSVRLTRAGQQLLSRVMPGLSNVLSELTECLKRVEKETIVRLLTHLRRDLRRRRKGGTP